MKTQKNITKAILLLVLFLSSSLTHAEDLIMMRVKLTFPETMVNLQSAIKKTGYTISRVQRVDIGLTKSGFKTDKYRVVFFGKGDEINSLTEKHPDIAALLPLKISIFAENNDTILVTNNPLLIHSYFKDMPKDLFVRWAKDVNNIFELTNLIE